MRDYINLLFSCCKDMYLFLIRKINAKIFLTTLFLALHITTKAKRIWRNTCAFLSADK